TKALVLDCEHALRVSFILDQREVSLGKSAREKRDDRRSTAAVRMIQRMAYELPTSSIRFLRTFILFFAFQELEMKLLVLTMMLCMMAAAQTNPKHKSRKAQPKAGGSQGVSCRSDDFMRESLALSPVNASQAGYHKHTDPLTKQTVELDAQLDDFSPTAIERQRKFYSAWQGCKRTRVSVQDSADWQLINDQIAS